MTNLFWVGCFPPRSRSIGDHAQTLAVGNFLVKHFSDYAIKRFYRTEIDDFFRQKVEPDDLIFIQSSGDFGDCYQGWHDTRKLIIERYPRNRIVQLPVSVHYDSPGHFEVDKIFFSDKPNLLILTRTKRGERLLRGNFGCEVKFFPCFTFTLKPAKLNAKRKGTLAVLRKDKESALRRHIPRKFMRRYVRNILNFLLDLELTRRLNHSFHDAVVKDVQVSSVDVTDVNREQVVMDALNFYQRFERVVTDRFHACVFASLTGTPFTPLTGKIKQKNLVDWNLNYQEYFQGFRSLVLGQPKLQATMPPVKTNILDVIRSRRSIRKWLPRQVEGWKLQAVLKAGVYAPTACNTQAVKFKVVTQQDLKQLICDSTALWFKRSLPAAIILILYDVELAERCSLRRNWHKRFVWQDTAAASMNMMLTAESLDLKSCWATFDPRHQRTLSGKFEFKNMVLCNALFLGYSSQHVDVAHALHQGRLVRRRPTSHYLVQ
jgi:exopolysaccharide biosynthesis predicted pyruvyltransferase EpsI/nitroreductase